MRSWSVLVLAAVVASASANVAGGAVDGSRAPVAPTVALDPREQSLVRAVNLAREAKGLRPLALDAELTRAARAHGRNLLANDAFTHAFVKRGVAYPFSTWIGWYYSHSCAGENLAEGQPTLTAALAVRLWLESPDHRANLLSGAYRTMGVALLSRGGTVIAVNTFGDC
jgi:uncharacterized protein YkwD